MEITVQTYDPTPDDVAVTTYLYEGKPRAEVNIGGINVYGEPGMLAAVLGQALRYVLGFGADARLEIMGTHGNDPEPKRYGIPAWKPAGPVEPEPLSGDYTFPASPTPKAGDVVRVIDADGETVGKATVSHVPEGLAVDMVVSDEMAKEIRGYVDGLSVGFPYLESCVECGATEPCEHSVPSTPAQDKIVDLMADLEASVQEAKAARKRHPTATEIEPFEDEGGPTDE